MASGTFALFFSWCSWYCSIIVLVLGSSSTYSQHINHSGKDSLKYSFEHHYFGPDLRLAQTKTVIPIQPVHRVVTRYMGSGIKGLKKGGIRDHSLGSGIKALGIGISVFSMGSRIRRLDNNNNLRCAPKHGFLKLFEIL